MLFNVAQLLRAPVGETRRYTVEPEPPLRRGRVELVRTPGAVLVEFEGEACAEAACSRCLAVFCYCVQVGFDEIFRQRVDAHGTPVPELEDDAEPFFILEDHLIDITEAVRQYTEMAAAMQPLCRPDCPGLCPTCGGDLNITSCACDRLPTDARWAALAALNPTSE